MTAVVRARIEYAVGNPHNPGDPFGRAELAVNPDGSATLVLSRLGGHRLEWRAAVDHFVVARVHATLGTAGFPSVPPHPMPAGTTTRELSLTVGADRGGAVIAWHAAKELPGYAEAFEILDSIVRAVSGDLWRAAPNTLPTGAVGEIVRVEV